MAHYEPLRLPSFFSTLPRHCLPPVNVAHRRFLKARGYNVQVLVQIEKQAPILAQQHVEYEWLQFESAQLASKLTDALTELDSSVSTATNIFQHLTKTKQLETQHHVHRLKIRAFTKERDSLKALLTWAEHNNKAWVGR
ncbi:hypothetical protein F5888DRAFT_1878363 [Russula emetica]|nr:hypothetical protein F5888DRAFT_1878363 [Russula emetica]